MSKRQDESPTIGIAVYRPEDWARLRRVAADSDALERNWADHCQTIAKIENQLRAAGVAFEEVPVELDELVRYCRDHGLKNNGEARSRFVAETLLDRHRSGDNPSRPPSPDVAE